jgi:hypothetical protein
MVSLGCNLPLKKYDMLCVTETSFALIMELMKVECKCKFLTPLELYQLYCLQMKYNVHIFVLGLWKISLHGLNEFILCCFLL